MTTLETPKNVSRAELSRAELSRALAEYLALPTRELIEFADGRWEYLPVPTQSHQLLLAFLFESLLLFVRPRGLGRVVFAPMRLRLRPELFREPDLMFLQRENLSHAGEQFWTRADLVMEVVSPDDPNRDWQTKRAEYAAAGIGEYWIVDPRSRRVTVLGLATPEATSYAVRADVVMAGRAESTLLPGFGVELTALFAAGES